MLTCRKANEGDVLLYFDWANDEEVRSQSYQPGKIDLEGHKKWFLNKIKDENCLMLLFENESKEAVGQVRLQKEDEEWFSIGISIGAAFRGKGFASKLFIAATDYFFDLFPSQKIKAYVKENNLGSIKGLEKAGFSFSDKLLIDGHESVLYTKIKSNANR